MKPEVLKVKGITADALKIDNLLTGDEMDQLEILIFDDITDDLKKVIFFFNF